MHLIICIQISDLLMSLKGEENGGKDGKVNLKRQTKFFRIGWFQTTFSGLKLDLQRGFLGSANSGCRSKYVHEDAFMLQKRLEHFQPFKQRFCKRKQEKTCGTCGWNAAFDHQHWDRRVKPSSVGCRNNVGIEVCFIVDLSSKLASTEWSYNFSG